MPIPNGGDIDGELQGHTALVFEGRSYDEIAGLVGCLRRDISLVKKTVTANGLTAATMSDEQ
ncbi:hypothetical protein [Cryobacterium sp. N19]|uniref:hypothetical protein n=1 Tax=Cryobacterium sp. N19 TaxID=2048288 RepID=UPI0011251710|nr:hypothetical protein [Cryobacterium sp. N19]